MLTLRQRGHDSHRQLPGRVRRGRCRSRQGQAKTVAVNVALRRREIVLIACAVADKFKPVSARAGGLFYYGAGAALLGKGGDAVGLDALQAGEVVLL